MKEWNIKQIKKTLLYKISEEPGCLSQSWVFRVFISNSDYFELDQEFRIRRGGSKK
jgi:hypothetical protein